MPKRLGLKLSLSLTVVVVVVAAVSGFLSWETQSRQLVRTMVLGADQLSKSITSATWHAMLADDRESTHQIMRTIAEKQGVDRIRMFNREGGLTFSTDPSERMQASSAICAPCHSSGMPKARVDNRVRIDTAPGGQRTLNIVTPIYNEASCSSAACHAHPANVKVLGVLDVALRLDVLDHEAAEISREKILTTLLLIALATGLIILLTRRFVGIPIHDLIDATKAVSAMELDKPIEIRNKSQELEELENSFNVMRERLKAALAELNEFTERLEAKVKERTDQLTRANQKLLHSDRLASLGQLSASVAHEINNPLSGVLNLSMLLERIMKDGHVPPGREEECKKYIERISKETARVGRIVSDLLAFSRRSKPQRSAADLNKLVRTTMSLVNHKLKLSDTAADMQLAENLPLVPCDPSQIQQVVLNLVMNAAEAMHGKPGSYVRVITRLAEDHNAVELVVQDNGEGIAPENLRRIFDPFFTTKPEGKGVGLGLAVLYGIVQAHEGEVEVKSTLGEGTAFIVTLPLTTSEKAPEAAPAVMATGQSG